MRIRFRISVLLVLFVAGILSIVSSVAVGQDQAAAPAKTASQSLTPDGQPEIQGVWAARPGGDSYDVTGLRPRPDFVLQGNGTQRPATHRIVDGTPDGNIPYLPWAAAKQKEQAENVDNPTKPEHVDTQAHCLLEGPARVFIHSGFQILQAPGYVLFFTEENDETRIIPLDNRPHIGQNIKLWQGDSRGHWEGNTLVIDVTNVKGKSRLDMVGNFYSSSTHFVERLTIVDEKTINYEATITDPTVYTHPWKLTARFVRRFANDGKYEIYEDACHEGERSANTMPVSADKPNKNSAPTKISEK